MKLLLVTSLLVIFAVAFSAAGDANSAGDAIIEALLRSLRIDHKNKIDPYSIPDRSVSYEKKIAFVDLSSEFRLYNCHVYGLSKLARRSEFSHNNTGGKIIISGLLGYDQLTANCSVRVKVPLFERKTVISAYATGVVCDTQFEVNNSTGHVTLTRFRLRDATDIQVTKPGRGIFNIFTKAALYAFSKFFYQGFKASVNVELAYLLRIITAHLHYKEGVYYVL